LITQAIEESRLTTLKGNTHPLARPEFDLGTASSSLPMQRMLLVLRRSAEQEHGLRKLLDDQQDKASPSYHKWLTPEQYGRQFGPSDSDLQEITSWLQSHGFQVGTTKGRTVLEFSGTAGQVEEAFHTTIHKYLVNNEQHWANATDPMIPAALTPAVTGVLTLHNFLKKPTLNFSGEPVAAKVLPGKKPQVTFPQNGGFVHALSPQDYGVIYNMNSLSVPSISTIAVVGRTNLYNGGQDVSNFLGLFGGGSFLITLNGPDPGDLGGGEEAEGTLDSSWATALAPTSTVNFVVSASTDTTDGVDLSETFIIENNLAAIMTESFSACELYATDSQLAFASTMAEQAAAQGITYIVSTGDSGAAGCDSPSVAPASFPVSVNYLASTPFTVAVGGTMFNENGQDATYWSTTAPISESALSYIPENVWNESSLSNGLWSGSGGASAGNIASGLGSTGGVPKPDWQSGVVGIPSDGVRDLPDVSLTAAQHDAYLLCLDGSCVPDSQGQLFVYFVSGTSASAPAFAGIMAYVDEQNSIVTGNPRVGSPNYVLYRLAATQSEYPSQCNGSDTAAAPAATCVFNDITTGNNVVPGEAGSEYQASAGYDLATGLGSLNVGNLVSNWNSVTFNPTTTTFSMTTTSNIAHGTAVNFNVSVAPSSGTGTPTGDVSLEAFTGLIQQGASGLTLAGNYKLSQGAVASSTAALPGGGPYWVTANYSGDSTYAPSQSAAVSVTVDPETSTTTVSVLTADQSGTPLPFSNGPFGSFVYLRADVAGQSLQGFATGTVTFTDTFGAIPGGNSFLLNSQGNTATPNGVVGFDTGTHTISANYSGDASFNASSTAQSQTFTITPGFYAAIPAAQSTVLISAPGGSGTGSISVANSTGFSGTITLACSGLPSEAACSFTPATITANGTLSETSVLITVTTKAATAMARSQQSPFLPAAWIFGFGLLLPGIVVTGRRHRAQGLFLLLMLVLLVVVPGCGGGGGGGGNHTPPPDPGTPTGVSNVVVTATSGSTSSASAFTLVVQ
jgi:subtilase family serine protease